MAASAGGIRAGKAYVEIGANASPLIRGLKAAQAKVRAFGTSVAGIAARAALVGSGAAAAVAAVAAPIALSVRRFERMGSALKDVSDRTGASVEALSMLRYAAEQTGTDLETVEAGLRRMQGAAADAASGSKSAQEAFARLGLSVSDLRGMSPDQMFDAVAKRLNTVADPTARAAAAMEIFGRSGTSLLPMISQLDALRAEAKSLGVVMSTDAAESADAVGDAFTMLRYVLDSVASAIGASFAPAVVAFTRKTAASLLELKPVIVDTMTGVGKLIGWAAEKVIATWNVISPTIVAIVRATIDLWKRIIEYVGPALTWLQDAVTTAFVAVQFAIENFGDVAGYVMLGAAYHVVRFANQVVYFFGEVLPGWIAWFADNWRDVFTAIWNFTKTVVTNIGRNLANLWQAIIDVMSGRGWTFQWTGLLEGFESAIKELPKIAEREVGGLEKSLGDDLDAIGKRLAENFERKSRDFRERLAAAPEAEDVELPRVGAAAAAARRLAGFDAEAMAEAAKRIAAVGTFSAAAVWGLGGNNAAERTARNTEQIARHTKRLAERDRLAFE